jgi:hypothetical protein
MMSLARPLFTASAFKAINVILRYCEINLLTLFSLFSIFLLKQY